MTQALDPFMSPYQQQVIDATTASFENQRAQQRQQIADQAKVAGAFGVDVKVCKKVSMMHKQI